jgi:alkaline phosphatase
MKLRNQLLALLCLLIFAAFGFLYVRAWVVQKPFGIILFVSDSLVARHLTAARLYEGGADHRLAIETLPQLALLNNSADDFSVPDAAAAATALATGVRVNHRSLATGTDGARLQTILDFARSSGRAVGLVTNGTLTGPGAAAFYAHTADSRDAKGIAAQFVDAPFRVALGGGSVDFLPQENGGERTDGRDLLADLRAKGSLLAGTKAELEDAPSYGDKPLLGLFSPGALAFSNRIESGSQQPSLADMVRKAVQCLQTNRKGYVLIVDASLVTTAAERNEGELVITETLALDRAVGMALRYAGPRSLILAVGRHGVGGMSLNGYPFRQHHGVALLGINATGQPAITWATGPKGPAGPAAPPPLPAAGGTPPAATPAAAGNEPAAWQTPSALNTAEDVLAAGAGPGSEKLHGFMDNTDIFRLLKDAL